MSVAWNDGVSLTASAISNPVFSPPLKGVKTEYVLKQDFMALLSGYVPADLNTAHGTYADYVLVEESEMTDLGGGVSKFTRTYAKVPDQYIQFVSYGYNFIGYWPPPSTLIQSTDTPGRDRFQQNIRAKFVTDYFLVGTGGAYADAGLIPQIEQTIYRYNDAFGSIANRYRYTDYLLSNIFNLPTTPTLEEYEILVDKDKGDIASFSIIAENSRLERWMGNIWARETRYVKAL